MEGTLDFSPWVDLPDPVKELILEHLPLSDYIRFATVCRKWGSIQKEHRLRHSTHPPPMGTHRLPWLIPYDLHFGTGFDCYIQPLEKKLHGLRFPTTPTFPGITLCMASSGGWLLMLDDVIHYDLDRFDGDPTLPIFRSPFLFNPLTRALIRLPMLSFVPGDQCFGALSFPPYDPDCTILLVSGGSVFLHRSNNHHDCWTTGVEIEERIDSAVYCGSKFYCISSNGALYVIDRVLSTPKLLPLTMDVSSLDPRDGNRCRLVEFGGELLLVVDLYRLGSGRICLERSG